MKDGLLPVGSCVTISNNSKEIMIAGFLPGVDEKFYDYIGIYTPVGIRKEREKLKIDKDYICFNKDEIEKVNFIGYSDIRLDAYLELLEITKDKFLKDKAKAKSEE